MSGAGAVVGAVQRGLLFVLRYAVLGVALVLGFWALPKAGQPFTAVALVAALNGVNLLVHEGGHYLAARSLGLRVLQWRVGMLELIARRRGFRVRWRRAAKGAPAGFVHMVPLPRVPMRKAFLVAIAAGPAANLVAAAFAGLAGLLLPGAAAAVAFAFAVISLFTGLANLYPMPSESNDGALLQCWWRQRDERAPLLAGVRLMALSIDGTPPDRLPVEDLLTLEESEPWAVARYRAKAAQLGGDWPAARRQWQQLID